MWYFRYVLVDCQCDISKDEQAAKKKLLLECIERLLKSTKFTTPFVGCLQRICFGDKDLTLDPSLVGDTAYRSLNFHTGIMLLEKQILQLMEPQFQGMKISMVTWLGIRVIDGGTLQRRKASNRPRLTRLRSATYVP